ncbi:MAG: FHA domain-containing protein [Pseudobutyrivibrio sp.]|nr:FHA domain-containing protein [Pseudobutyrivibrio sp.]
MNITYKRQHNESYMVIPWDGVTDNLEQRMIEENSINALLETRQIQVDDENAWHYNISQRVSLRDYLQAEDMSIELVQRIILYISLCLEETDKYLINQNHILLNSDSIFLKKGREGFDLKLCYYPMDNGDIASQFSGVLGEVLGLLDKSDKNLSELMYRLYDLSLRQEYTLKGLLEVIDEEIGYEKFNIEHIDLREAEEDNSESLLFQETKGPAMAESGIGDVVLENESEYFYDEDSLEEDCESQSVFEKMGLFLKSILSGRRSQSQEKVYEDFLVEPDYEVGERTVLLSDDDMVCQGKLIYDGDGNQESFLIDKDEFKIGSGKNNDGVIHSRAVSSSHAKIIKKGSTFFLTDLNSLNGSVVDGKIASYKQMIKLKPMSQIKFADADYVFM